MTTARLRILCVDDEPKVLEGLAPHLRRRYDLESATSGAEGLAVLERFPEIAVILSDMRMPGMDGATFLGRSRQIAPDAVRILLTGQADVQAAIAAINDGQIFRFLTKPCPPPLLTGTFEAAAQQHQLVISERVLLEQTLHGSIKALTDTLAIVSPAAFGRATRIKQLVSELLTLLDVRDRWQVEVAAMLSQLGSITLPPETADKVYYGHALTPDEQKLVARLPALTEELLGNIPRLDEVREILRMYPKPYCPDAANVRDPKRRLVARGAQILRVAVDFDALESSGLPSSRLAVDTLRGRQHLYDRDVLEALASSRGPERISDVRELPASQLQVGMILAEDVKLRSGALLVARGYEITERFLERARNIFSSAMLPKATWRVIVTPARQDAVV